MQHEILLSLAGCPGSIFAVSRDSGLFEVSLESASTPAAFMPGMVWMFCKVGNRFYEPRSFIVDVRITSSATIARS